MTIDEAIKYCLETVEESEEMTAKAREDFANVEIPEDINYYGLLYNNIAKWLGELKTAQTLLRIANETIYELLDCGAACSSRMCDAHCIYNAEDCPINEMEGTTSCEGIRKWKYAAEVDKLLK